MRYHWTFPQVGMGIWHGRHNGGSPLVLGPLIQLDLASALLLLCWDSFQNEPSRVSMLVSLFFVDFSENNWHNSHFVNSQAVSHNERFSHLRKGTICRSEIDEQPVLIPLAGGAWLSTTFSVTRDRWNPGSVSMSTFPEAIPDSHKRDQVLVTGICGT